MAQNLLISVPYNQIIGPTMRRAFMNKMPILALAALASASLVSTPAVAQDYDGYDYASDRDAPNDMGRDMGEAVDKLNDPEFQDKMGNLMGAMMEAMMSMKIGGIAKAARQIDPDSDMADMHPDTTVGDMVSDGDLHYADRMRDKTRGMARSAGVMASGMARMAPVLAEMAREMGAQMEKNMGREMRQISKEIERDTY